MKKKIIICIIVLILGLWFVLLIMNPEPHFTITKEGIEINEIRLRDNIIKKSELNQEWLKDNCEYYNNKYICGEYSIEVWNQIK